MTQPVSIRKLHQMAVQPTMVFIRHCAISFMCRSSRLVRFCLQSLTNSIREATDAGRQKELLCSARLALRIFFSMNNPGLTEVRMSPFINAALHECCTACWSSRLL